jgi:hypothetical protein
VELILDLGLMSDALHQLPELGLELQKCNINLYSAKNNIKHLAPVFEGDVYIPDSITEYPSLLPIA